MLSAAELHQTEIYYPLIIFVCGNCFLVQLSEYAEAKKIFSSKYTYFSSFSSSWLAHAKNYTDMIVDKLNLGKESFVLEIASNDGYLLQYFQEKGIPTLGVEPASKVGEVAIKKGIDTIIGYFDRELVANSLRDEYEKANLIIGNNVIAHVPDTFNFSLAMKMVLQKSGTITLEFPHLLRLIERCQFDTIYSEHYSYFSLYTLSQILLCAGLEIYAVEELPTHGGSLRVFVGHTEDNFPISQSVDDLVQQEIEFGLTDLHIYTQFQARVDKVKYEFLEFLFEQNRQGKKVVGYGAAGKGNTLLNYCGIKGNDLIRFVADVSPYKQNLFLPGSHIPVVSGDHILREKPDFIIVLPWNIKEEIIGQLNYVREWGCKFVVAIPELEIF